MIGGPIGVAATRAAIALRTEALPSSRLKHRARFHRYARSRNYVRVLHAIHPMRQSSWMLVRIGLDTHAHHATADADRLKVLDVVGPAQYASYLTRVHGFEAPVELALAAIPGMLVHLATRPKAGQLRRDLLALGLTDPDVAALPRCLSIPAMRSTAQALGWLYVLERNTLIAGLLRRHLTHRMPTEMMRASAYLAASSVASGARLRAFGEALAAEAEHGPHAIAEMVAAATEAFRCQRQWLRSWTPTSHLGSRGERTTRDTAPPLASSDRADSAAS